MALMRIQDNVEGSSQSWKDSSAFPTGGLQGSPSSGHFPAGRKEEKEKSGQASYLSRQQIAI